MSICVGQAPSVTPVKLSRRLSRLISFRNQASGSKLNHVLNVSYFVLMVSSYEEKIAELLPKEERKARNLKSSKAKISLNRRQILFEECLLNNSSLVGQYDREILLLGGIRD